MASTKTSGIRCSEAEYISWVAMAQRLGLAFNAWARRALNEQCELDAALLRELDSDLQPQAGRAPGEEFA